MLEEKRLELTLGAQCPTGKRQKDENRLTLRVQCRAETKVGNPGDGGKTRADPEGALPSDGTGMAVP